jgi:hypothetical protein
MDFTLITPAFFFFVIFFLLLAYGNRFLVLASLVRELCDRWEKKRDEGIGRQIENLKRRIGIIKSMQLLGVLSFLLSVLTMLLLFLGFTLAAETVFALGLVSLLLSLGLSIRELFISADALDILLDEQKAEGLSGKGKGQGEL